MAPGRRGSPRPPAPIRRRLQNAPAALLFQGQQHGAMQMATPPPNRKRRSYFDVRSPFFLPLWRRVAVVAVCVAWVGVEVLAGSLGWAAFVGAIAAFLIYEFFIAFDPAQYTEEDDP